MRQDRSPQPATPPAPAPERARRLQALAQSLGRAAEHSSHYRQKYAAAGLRPEQVRDEEQWARVPFTTKDDLRAAYPFGLLAVEPSALAMILESSGTSGEPTASYMTAADLEDCYRRVRRNAIGIGPQDRILIRTPYSMLSTAHQMQGAARQAAACVLPADNRTELMTYGRLVRMLRDYRVTVLYCLPIELLRLARRALAEGLEPTRDFPALRGCLVNGEMLSEGKRRFLASLWGTRIYQDYGSTETTRLAAECPEGRLHANEDSFHFECRDPGGDRCAEEGRGELVVTSLRREAMPLVRYAIGDFVELRRTDCPCGDPGREISVWGRLSEQIECQGRRFFPLELEDAIYGGLLGLPPVFFRGEYDQRRLVVSLETQERSRRALEERAAELAGRCQLRLGVTITCQVLPERGLHPLSSAGSPAEERPSQKPVYIRRLAG